MADNVEVFRIVVDYQTAIDNLNKVETELQALKNEQKRLTEEVKKGTLSEAEYNAQLAAVKTQIRAKTEEVRQAAKEVKTITTLNKAEEGSLVALRAQYLLMAAAYDRMSKEERESAHGTLLLKHLKELSDEMVSAESATGRYSRNVGNYASGFSPLNFQVQQLARELPSLTVSAQQFFLAISNNLPMLVDEMQRARVANEALKKAGETTVPVWKQMLKSIGSWQTMLVVGITLLTAYGKEIGQWVAELFKGKKQLNAAVEAQKIYNATMTQGLADSEKTVTSLRILYDITQNQTIAVDKRRQAAEKLQKLYPSYLGNLTTEQIITGKAAQAYERLAEAIIRAARARAAEDKIADISSKLDTVTDSEAYKTYQQASKLLARLQSQQEGALAIGDMQEVERLNKLIATTRKIYEENENEARVLIENIFDTEVEESSTAIKDIATLTARENNSQVDRFVQAQMQAIDRLGARAAEHYIFSDPSDDQRDTEAAAREALKAAKEAADQRKKIEDDTIKYMREGREKDLADQKLKYQRAREEYKGNSEKLQELEEWNRNQILEINEKWDEKELDEYDKKLKAQLDLLEDGTDKKIALLKLERAKLVRQAIMNGASVVEATEQANKWYKIKEKEIRDATPEGKRDLKLAQIENTYEFEKACINQLDISDGERYKKLAELENKRRKDQADTTWAYIQQQYEAGKITQEVYEKNRKLYAGFYAEIANEAADIANIDTISAGGTSEKGLAKAAKRKSRQEKSNSFFGKLFGIDPKSKEGKAQIKQEKKELLNLAVDTARDIGQAVIDIQTEISQRRLKLEQERIDAERDSELKSLELRYNKGLMSEKAYNKAVEATNAEADRKKEEAERAAFEREKRLKIMGIAIDTAAGITKVWSETGLTGWKLAMAVAQTAFLTANGIAQTAVISSQQFAKGGIVPIGNGKNGVSMGVLQGPSHSQGGIPLMVNGQPVNAEVEGGEILAVINKRSAAQYLPLFSAINATNGVKFENGGVIGSGWSLPTPAPLPPSNGQLIAQLNASIQAMRIDFNNGIARSTKATLERVDNIKVHVVEKDITKTQKKVASIRAKATIIGGK